MLKDKEAELSKATERLSDQDPVDVDEAVTTTAPLYKQYVPLNLLLCFLHYRGLILKVFHLISYHIVSFVCITSIFSSFRILNSYAEEAALEDTIYYVGEALRRGVIDLDVFLKQVRSLSRRQFMLRALMQKCRQKAGLK